MVDIAVAIGQASRDESRPEDLNVRMPLNNPLFNPSLTVVTNR